MKHYVGLDVSLEETFVCVLEENGETLWQGKTKSNPDAICRVVRKKAPNLIKAGFEAGPLSTWHWHKFKEMGFPVVCLDARHAKAALSMQINKTDKNDACGLAQIVRTGWYRGVKVKSMESHVLRSLLAVRSQLVRVRTQMSNQLRGILKNFGLIVGRASGRSLEQRVLELTAGNVMVQDIVNVISEVWKRVCDQIDILDQELCQFSRTDAVCKRLMSVPGVGPVTAVAFMTAIDNPGRFKRSSSVGAYLGLTPRRYQSGEVDRTGKISKCGDSRVRSYLYEAAGVLLLRVKKWSRLKAWGIRLAARVGIKKAKVAVARKLSIILYRIWVDDSKFQWSGK